MTKSRLVSNKSGVTGPVVAVVMDGIGIGLGDEADAVAKAHTPHLDSFNTHALTLSLTAHGTAVGMPSDSDMGNSEVGHNALGAGRVFDQGAKLVSNAIATGALFEGKVWHKLVRHLMHTGGALHLIGLLSDGNVHSHIDHVDAILRRANAEGLPKVWLHALLDGRDVPKTCAEKYVTHIEQTIANLGRPHYGIASGGGRMRNTMDRYESDWAIVERGWRAHVHGEAQGFSSAKVAIESMRQQTPGIIDQDLPAFVVTRDGAPLGPIRDGDAVVLFNFRGDRMLQLCAAFEEEHFSHFNRGHVPDVFFCGMTLYDGDEQRPNQFLVAPPQIENTLGELLCDKGIGQIACSETQKFGHVTYFWNGNHKGAFDKKLERYIEIPSHPPPFDLRPQMQAEAITDAVIQALDSGRFRHARLNYANADMVGHTGHFDATVKAVEAVDCALGRLWAYVLDRQGALIVTADHGNADDMAERNKKTGAILRDDKGHMVIKTSHSLNPVPMYVLLPPKHRASFALQPITNPGLGHIAATIACLLGFEQPEGYLPSLLKTL